MARSLLFFPLLLRESLIETKRTPSYISKRIGLSEQTILKWLQGSAIPLPINVWRISELMGRLGPALIASYMHWYPSRFAVTGREGQSDLAQTLLAITSRTDSTDDLADDELVKYLDAWYVAHDIAAKSIISIWDYNNLNNVHDQVFRLPTPSIELIENWREVARHIAKDSSHLYNLDWKKFEELIAGLLESHGWEIRPQGYTKDGGIDLIAVRLVEPKVPISMLVQCKRFNKDRRVGVQVVREVWSIKWRNAFHQAMIATSSSFTKGAREEANQWNMMLSDHDNIVSLCRKIGQIII